jgi:hypothetical protein
VYRLDLDGLKERKMESSGNLSIREDVSDRESSRKPTHGIGQGLLSSSLGLNLLLIEYIVLARVTSLNALLSMTTPFYAVASLFLGVAVPFMFGAAIVQAISSDSSSDRWRGLGYSLLGGLFGILSIGCPTCGAPLLSALGIEEGLAAFPLQGLEIKFISVLLLGIALWPVARPAQEQDEGSGSGDELESSDRARPVRTWTGNWSTGLLLIAAITAIFALPLMPERIRLDFSTGSAESASWPEQAVNLDIAQLAEEINPAEGFAFPAAYGNIGPQLLASGAIDEEKFSAVHEQAGDPLTPEQRRVLTERSEGKIVIARENAYFLLNFLWALGLVNQNPILDEGPMMTYSEGEIGRFASTGGWPLGTEAATELYSSAQIIHLTREQQEMVEGVAAGVFRPCCNNPTIFPDCNHGMAMLGLLELLASQGASEEQLFQGAKSANAFWFPQQMLEVATYFKAVKGEDFAGLDPRVGVSSTYFSGSGFQGVNAWLADSGLIRQAPSQGGSCGT